MHKQVRTRCQSFHIGAMLVLAILGLTGCGQSQLEATPNTMALISTPAGTSIGMLQGIETPTQTRTPTATFTPSMTPTVTYTPIPTLPLALDPLPPEPPLKAGQPSSVRDVVVTNASAMFHIQRGTTPTRIGGWTPDSGKKYLVFDGMLYNFGQADQGFFDTDFVLQLPDGQFVNPDVRASGVYRDERRTVEGGTVIEFPGSNYDRLPGRYLSIPRTAYRRIVIAYQIPENVEDVILQFVVNGLPYQAIQIALVHDPDAPDQLIMITTRRGDANRLAFAYEIVDGKRGEPRPFGSPERVDREVSHCVAVDTPFEIEIVNHYIDEASLVVEQGSHTDFQFGLLTNGESGDIIAINPISVLVAQLDRLGLGVEAQHWYESRYSEQESREFISTTRAIYTVQANHRMVTTQILQPIVTPYIIAVLVDNQLFEYQYAVEGTQVTTDRQQEPCTP